MTITARFASTCPTCGSRIVAGERVNWSKGSKATHVGCGAARRPMATRLNPGDRSEYMMADEAYEVRFGEGV